MHTKGQKFMLVGNLARWLPPLFVVITGVTAIVLWAENKALNQAAAQHVHDLERQQLATITFKHLYQEASGVLPIDVGEIASVSVGISPAASTAVSLPILYGERRCLLHGSASAILADETVTVAARSLECSGLQEEVTGFVLAADGGPVRGRLLVRNGATLSGPVVETVPGQKLFAWLKN